MSQEHHAPIDAQDGIATIEPRQRRRTTSAKRRSVDTVPFFNPHIEEAEHDGSARDGSSRDGSDSALLRARTAQHWDVLRSPYRMRLFEAIRACGGCSVRELAASLETSCTALYYHIERLEQAGLILAEAAPLPEGEHYRGGRRPAIYRAAASSVVVECEATSARDMRRLKKLGEAWADETRAESGRPHLRGSCDEATADVEFARWECVTPAEAQTVRELMGQIEAVLDHARARRETGQGEPTVANSVVACLCTVPRDRVFPNPTLGIRVVHSTPGTRALSGLPEYLQIAPGN